MCFLFFWRPAAHVHVSRRPSPPACPAARSRGGRRAVRSNAARERPVFVNPATGSLALRAPAAGTKRGCPKSKNFVEFILFLKVWSKAIH